MKVYFENQSGEVVGTITDYQFSMEAAGGYWRVPSFVVAMPDGTFKVVDIEKCRHKMNQDVAGNVVIVSEEYLRMTYKKYDANTDEIRRQVEKTRMMDDIAELLGALPDRLPFGDITIGHQRLLVGYTPNGETRIGFAQGISVVRKEGNPNLADVYYEGSLLGNAWIKNNEKE